MRVVPNVPRLLVINVTVDNDGACLASARDSFGQGFGAVVRVYAKKKGGHTEAKKASSKFVDMITPYAFLNKYFIFKSSLGRIARVFRENQVLVSYFYGQLELQVLVFDTCGCFLFMFVNGDRNPYAINQTNTKPCLQPVLFETHHDNNSSLPYIGCSV